MKHCKRRFVLALLSALTSASRPAQAQASDSGAAEALFQAGKRFLEQNDYAHACPKLFESYRLDPGTGTLLALALCHEGEGRIASAWGEFADVAVRSRREGRGDREEVAKKHKDALEPRLPMLTVSVEPGGEKIEGLRITRDGVEVGSGSWTTPVPVDPGSHHVEASAPGYRPFAADVTLATDGSRQSVVVPILVVERTGSIGSAPESQRRRGFWTPVRYAGLALGVVGIAGIGLGTAFGIRAIGLNNESKRDCDPQSVCGPSGFSTRHDAQWAGNVSTVAFVGGGVLLAGGAALFAMAKPTMLSSTGWLAAPVVSTGEFGLHVEGAF